MRDRDSVGADMIDRSGRTCEEYRQLYWDEKARRKELEAQRKSINWIIESAIAQLIEIENRNDAKWKANRSSVCCAG